MSKRKRQPTGDYQVGYAKPPESGRFKPGQSGNPRGRRKGTKNFMTYFMEEAESLVTLNSGQSSKKITKVQALAMTMFNKAVQGDSRTIVGVAKLLLEFDREHHGTPDMSQEDREIFEFHMARLSKKGTDQ